MVWPAIIGALGSLGSAFLSGNSAERTNSRNRAWQEKMYQQQLEDNRENATIAYERQNEFYDKQWNNMVEYNSPTAQMQRFNEAGINPNLAVGQFQATASSPSSNAPEANSASWNPFQESNVWADMPNQLTNLINAITPLFNKGVERQNIIADTLLKGADVENTNADTELKGKQSVNEEKKSSLYDSQISKYLKDIELTDEQKNKIKVETAILQDYLDDVRPKEKAKLDADTKKILEDTRSLTQQIENTQQIFPQQLAQIKKQLLLLDQQFEMGKLQKEKFEKELQRYKTNFEKILALDSQSLDAAGADLARQDAINKTHAKVVGDIMGSLNSYHPENDALKLLNDVTKMLLLYLDGRVSSSQVPDYWNK